MRLPEDLCRRAADLLQERYGHALEPGESFVVRGSLFAGEAEVRIEIEKSDPLERVGPELIEVAAKVGVPEGARDADEALGVALDASDAFMGEWLEAGREERHSIDFVDHYYRGRPVSIRMRRSRPALEAEAERILRRSGFGSTEDGE